MRKKICKDRNLYYVWHEMKARCEKPDHPRYYMYGANGRKVCDEWSKSYGVFQEWALSNGYRHGLSIDRINNDKGYSPENCRWTDRLTQQNNTSANRRITLDGETHTLIEWIRKKGLCKRTIYYRMKKGMKAEDALTIPIKSQMASRKKRKSDEVVIA